MVAAPRQPVDARLGCIPGNRRLISDFKHGRLAPADDPARLAEVIVGQWTDFDRAFHMSRLFTERRRYAVKRSQV